MIGNFSDPFVLNTLREPERTHDLSGSISDHKVAGLFVPRRYDGQSIGIEASSNGDLRAAIRRQRTRIENADRRAEDLAEASESGLLTKELLAGDSKENPRRRTIVR